MSVPRERGLDEIVNCFVQAARPRDHVRFSAVAVTASAATPALGARLLTRDGRLAKAIGRHVDIELA